MTIKDILFIVSLCFLFYFFCIPEIKADEVQEIPTKCEHHRSKIKQIEKQFADRIFILWLKDGSTEDPRILYERAKFTAWWILRDNNVICKVYK